MRVQIIDNDGETIWSSNEINIESIHDPKWRGGFKPYITSFQPIIDVLSISINQAKKDETHCMISHKILSFNDNIQKDIKNKI